MGSNRRTHGLPRPTRPSSRRVSGTQSPNALATRHTPTHFSGEGAGHRATPVTVELARLSIEGETTGSDSAFSGTAGKSSGLVRGNEVPPIMEGSAVNLGPES